MTAPLPWVQQLQQLVIDTREIPLSGYHPPFPWEEVSKKIALLLHTPDLKVIPKTIHTLPPEALSQGWGSSPSILTLQLTPLTGQSFFLMGQEEIQQLTSLCLTTPPASSKGFLSAQMREGFYYYLCTELAALFNTLHPFGNLPLKIGKAAPLPSEEALCIDIEIQLPKLSCFGRVICPASFHQQFKAHFQDKTPSMLEGAITEKIPLSASITVGQTELSWAEWKSVRVGDFVTLDRCTFDPKTHKGTAFLSLENIPLLRLRIKEEGLKIVNYVTYREESPTMDVSLPPSDENEEEFSSPELSEEPNGDHLWSTESTPETGEEPLLSTEKIPLTLIVEVGRVTMSLDQLLNLSPGNMVELAVRPEQGVDLTIQGKKVAKGELVKIGEMLGVKILKLAE